MSADTISTRGHSLRTISAMEALMHAFSATRPPDEPDASFWAGWAAWCELMGPSDLACVVAVWEVL